MSQLNFVALNRYTPIRLPLLGLDKPSVSRAGICREMTRKVNLARIARRYHLERLPSRQFAMTWLGSVIGYPTESPGDFRKVLGSETCFVQFAWVLRWKQVEGCAIKHCSLSDASKTTANKFSHADHLLIIIASCCLHRSCLPFSTDLPSSMYLFVAKDYIVAIYRFMRDESRANSWKMLGRKMNPMLKRPLPNQSPHTFETCPNESIHPTMNSWP